MHSSSEINNARESNRQTQLQVLWQKAEALMQSGARVFVDEANLKISYIYSRTPSISTVATDREPHPLNWDLSMAIKRLSLSKEQQEAERQALLEELKCEAKDLQKTGFLYLLDEENAPLWYEGTLYPTGEK